MNKATIISTSAIALLIAGLSFNAIADSNNKAATAEAQQNAAITLTQAITIAEQATGGTNSEAEFELEDGVALYEVEIDMPDGSEIELEIDAQSGAILTQKTEDDDNDHDKNEDHEKRKDKDTNNDKV